MMKKTQARSIETQERILDAARVNFSQFGYEYTSVEKIAKTAGVAKASVFAHFGDKANVLAAIGASEISSIISLSRDYIAKQQTVPAAAAVFEFYKPWLSFFLENPDFTKLYFGQLGVSKGNWTFEFIQSCSEQENLIAQLIEKLAKMTANSASTPQFFARGSQAFFFQIVGYRINGWIGSDEEAQKALMDYLEVWFSNCDNPKQF